MNEECVCGITNEGRLGDEIKICAITPLAKQSVVLVEGLTVQPQHYIKVGSLYLMPGLVTTWLKIL